MSTTETPSAIVEGALVRIIAHAQPAYDRAYWGKVGMAMNVSQSRTGVRRWLVDYLPTGGTGRYQVREEHLERVAAGENEPQQPVTVASTRKRSARQGSSGSPASANACPLGYDPIRHCATELMQPWPSDPRFARCSKCGKDRRMPDSEVRR